MPEHLPCVEEIVDPLPVQAEPQAWRYIGEEVSEQLDYEPARFLRRRMIRRKYVKRGELDAVPVIAPLPPVLQERCIAAPGLLAQVIVARYCDHRVPRATSEGWADVPASRATIQPMRVGPSEPADRSRFQITSGGCGQKTRS